MKTGKCVVVIMYMTVVCLTCGCAVSSSSGHGSADVESEKYMEQTEVVLPGNSEEPESLLAEEPTKPESSEETESPLVEEPTEQESIEEVEYPSEEEIAALGIPEDMLAYWLVLNNKITFISVNQEGQKFFWNEYFWMGGMRLCWSVTQGQNIFSATRTGKYMAISSGSEGCLPLVKMESMMRAMEHKATHFIGLQN